ncbi:two-component system, chemotaxis family, response regulator CheY [Phyllobacterium sp. YR620]|nr:MULTISPECIES: response regulator [Phyllobacterium]UGY09484.1 response regulator [Phyllobacterium sp. T1018]SDO80793.1 two-component system, chemotaxis family, response regulator CheY [Phyllobacterium sp. YR620]SFJ36419.1 two-component system, chemotaxis family, response regulator CheY [Phyllobacterium sp. CL33Tsu]
MIIDGSPVVRKVARRLIASETTVVTTADTGFQTVAACSVEMPDIIILDSAIADMPAADVIAQVKSLPGGANSKIYLCLPEIDLAKIMRAKRAGAAGYLLKPFNRASIAEILPQVPVAG